MNRSKIMKLVLLRNLIAIVLMIPLLYFSFYRPLQEALSFSDIFSLLVRTILHLLVLAGVLSLSFLPFFARAGGVTILDYWRRTLPRSHNTAATGKDPYILEE